MGRSHALSGAAGWLGGCAVLATCGVPVTPVAAWAGAAVSAGMALLPDIDHPGSTVSRTLGPLTRGLSHLVTWAARTTQRASCGHCRSDRDAGGHRGLTHTAAGAAAVGILVEAGVLLGERFTLPVVGFAVWLAAHTALSSKVRAKVGDILLPGRFRYLNRAAFRFTAAVGAILTALVVVGLVHDAPTNWWWLGAAVGWGCLAHSLGDALTYSRVPLLWPLRIDGCRWARVGAPKWLRFRTGSGAEQVVVVLLGLMGIAAAWLLGVAA